MVVALTKDKQQRGNSRDLLAIMEDTKYCAQTRVYISLERTATIH